MQSEIYGWHVSTKDGRHQNNLYGKYSTEVTVQPPPLSEFQEFTKGAVNGSIKIVNSSPKKIEKFSSSPQLQNTQ
jgi:hypothetical protein